MVKAMKGQKTLNNNFEQSYPPYKHLDKDAVYDINIIMKCRYQLFHVSMI